MNHSTVDEINSQIRNGNFSNAELQSIAMAVMYARTQISKQNRRQLSIGSMVKFTDSRNGRPVQGSVSKIGTKNVYVTTPVGQWRVSANLIELI